VVTPPSSAARAKLVASIRVVGDAVRPALPLRRLDLELGLEGTEERVEEVEEQPVAEFHQRADFLLDQRAEHDGPHAVVERRGVDLPYGFHCLVSTGDKWQSHLPKFEPVELREQAVPHRLGSHAGLIRHEKYGSSRHSRVALPGKVSSQSFIRPLA